MVLNFGSNPCRLRKYDDPVNPEECTLAEHRQVGVARVGKLSAMMLGSFFCIVGAVVREGFSGNVWRPLSNISCLLLPTDMSSDDGIGFLWWL